MSLGDHLRELRKRLVIAAIALVIAMVVAYFLTDPFMALITQPVHDLAAKRGETAKIEVMYTTVTGAFDLKLRMSFAIALLLSAPVWLWQLWAFIMPGLTRKEIRYTVGFVCAAIPLFFAGVVTGMVVMPNIVRLMAEFLPDGTAALYDAKYYYDFVLKLLLIVGIAFVLPVFLVALNFAGIMSGKAIMRSWRIAVVIAIVVASIATPPADIVSTFLLAGILIVLFFAAAGLSMLFDRRRAKRVAAELGPLA
ncbi:MAG: twin arginine-targeting protein translocase TatC [Microbacterium sp. SCN 70-27]|uniref:twin-arginine translocase subunit TatC n=1 Tax=unclassified Microbacterium TaxID=2609290 RepID=UPI00086ADE02|nr:MULTISPECIES: twin-arginine translocase subunit TatC [unclassified Microbacterium]MBN9225010.1 twin-arginine translocase subunit TatC [Microbacterium sp.]ODT28041.1 MAG: twin arginine-targeting protein translocase TatC [Microbacterium sp. SCN 70-27]